MTLSASKIRSFIKHHLAIVGTSLGVLAGSVEATAAGDAAAGLLGDAMVVPPTVALSQHKEKTARMTQESNSSAVIEVARKTNGEVSGKTVDPGSMTQTLR